MPGFLEGPPNYFYVKGNLKVWLTTSPFDQPESGRELLSERLRFFEKQVESMIIEEFAKKLAQFFETVNLKSVLLVDVDSKHVFSGAISSESFSNLNVVVERLQAYIQSVDYEPDSVTFEVIGESHEFHVLVEVTYRRQHSYGGQSFEINVTGVPVEFTKSMPLLDFGAWANVTEVFMPVDSDYSRQYLKKFGTVMDEYASKIRELFFVKKTHISTRASGIPIEDYAPDLSHE